METKTFERGTHPPAYKEMSSSKAITELPVPPEVIIPLHQHTGAPTNPTVSVGDEVLVGQKLGDSDAFISAPVHSSVSGKVTAIEPRRTFTGAQVQCVVIKTDGKQNAAEMKGVDKDPKDLTPDEIRNAAKAAGIVGLGGAAFPTSVKLTPPKDKVIDSVLINGCECEPFLTCDHRLMIEKTKDLVDGTKLLMKAVNARKAYFGIEVNKMDAISAIEGKKAQGMEVVPLETKYPQGAEKQLIYAILNRVVPSGKLPSEVGALVQNIGTTIALNDMITKGKPLYERALTVTGPGVREPKNLLVKIGTPISFVIDACGGLTGDVASVILGGPMTGFAQEDLTVPVVKGTSGILAFTRDMVPETDTWLPCVRCSECVKSCPMNLMPNMLGVLGESGNYLKAENWNALDCFECGVCAYVCPAKRPLVQFIRDCKREILASRK